MNSLFDSESKADRYLLSYDINDVHKTFLNFLSPNAQKRKEAEEKIFSFKYKNFEDALEFFKYAFEGIPVSENPKQIKSNRNYLSSTISITSNSTESKSILRHSKISRLALQLFKKLFIDDPIYFASVFNFDVERYVQSLFQSLITEEKEEKYLERLSEILVKLTSAKTDLIRNCIEKLESSVYKFKYFAIYTIQLLIDSEEITIKEIDACSENIKSFDIILYLSFNTNIPNLSIQGVKLFFTLLDKCKIYPDAEKIKILLKSHSRNILKATIICLKSFTDKDKTATFNKAIANEILGYLNEYACSDIFDEYFDILLTLINELLNTPLIDDYYDIKVLTLSLLSTLSNGKPAKFRIYDKKDKNPKNEILQNEILPTMIKLSYNLDYIEPIDSNKSKDQKNNRSKEKDRVEAFPYKSATPKREKEKTNNINQINLSNNITNYESYNPESAFNLSKSNFAMCKTDNYNLNLKGLSCFGSSVFLDKVNANLITHVPFEEHQNENIDLNNLNNASLSPITDNNYGLNFSKTNEDIEFHPNNECANIFNNLSNYHIDSKSSKIKTPSLNNSKPISDFANDKSYIDQTSFTAWTLSDDKHSEMNFQKILYYPVMETIEALAANIKEDFFKIASVALNKVTYSGDTNKWIAKHNKLQIIARIINPTKICITEDELLFFKENLMDDNPRIRYAAIIGITEIFNSSSLEKNRIFMLINEILKYIEHEKNEKVLCKLYDLLSFIFFVLKRDMLIDIIRETESPSSIKEKFQSILIFIQNNLEYYKQHFNIVFHIMTCIESLSKVIGVECYEEFDKAIDYIFTSIKDIILNDIESENSKITDIKLKEKIKRAFLIEEVKIVKKIYKESQKK